MHPENTNVGPYPASADFSSVHTESLKLQNPAMPTYRQFLINPTDPAYQLAARFYSMLAQHERTNHYDRFLSCRTHASFARHSQTGQVKVLTSSCHLRFCPFCTKSRGTMIYKNVTSWLQSAKFPKFLTFTLKHSDDPLDVQMNRIYDCFKAVRRLSIFTRNVSGGIWFYQIKKSEKTNEWHPHIHCIVSGKYLAHAKLKTAWHKITGDSNIVDIRLIHDQKKAADYVARYAVKPCDLRSVEFEDMRTIYHCVERRRLCGTWGTCRELRLTTPPKFDSSKWQQVGSWQNVLMLARTDARAKAIYDSWVFDTPLAENISILTPENFFDTSQCDNVNVESKRDLLLF